MLRSADCLTISKVYSVYGAVQCALLANAAGIGGGPFYIPLFNTLLGFGTYMKQLKESV